jgi:hypothetical protein
LKQLLNIELYLCATSSYKADIVENMKKFRLVVQPGELRLKRDIQERDFLLLQQTHNIEVKFISRQPIVLQVSVGSFSGDERFPNLFPRDFTVSIPRYYPHEAPKFFVTDPEFRRQEPWCRFVALTDGRLAHHALVKVFFSNLLLSLFKIIFI